jgi:hypothetical protein
LSVFVTAHAGHWLEAIGFALAPLIVIAGIAAIAVSERRRSKQP